MVKNLKLTTSLILIAIGVAVVAPSAWGTVLLQGSAELDYTKYDASVAGKEIFTGRTMAQKYSLTYTASNYYFREQPRYYDLKLNYNITDFNTRITDVDQSFRIHDTFGRLGFSGAVGFNPPDMPIRFKAFVDQETSATEVVGVNGNNLIADSLLYGIDSGGKVMRSGATLAFEPNRTRNANLYGLPRLLLDYKETTVKKSDSLLSVDNRTRQLAVAGLNKENNWLNYRSTIFEDNINALNNFTRQQLQIGHVDNLGQRKWASLTNWIEVSADGQLTTVKTTDPATSYEEYDLNFMAIATRKKWSARTFTSYNRRVEDLKIIENATLPVYIKGIYGAETDWYVTVSTRRGRELYFASGEQLPTFTNNIGVGGTTFNRSAFTLSPAISLETRRDSSGAEAYAFSSSLESVSTRRFSDKLGLSGKVSWEAKDDGLNASESKSWHGFIDLKSDYKPNYAWMYRIQQQLESGSGFGYLQNFKAQQTAAGSGAHTTYYRSYTMGSATWTPNARVTSNLSGYLDAVTATGLPVSKVTNLTYNLAYNQSVVQLHANSRYMYTDNGVNVSLSEVRNYVEALYRPDRYSDSMLRTTHNYTSSGSTVTNSLEVIQRYNYKFFTRTGVSRNLATIGEEFKFTGLDTNGHRLTAKSLMLSGRYSPTEKISLYGSAKYETSDPNITVLFYNAGIGADFKLLTTSIDYSYAKRDSDNRIEKKLAATVKRVF